MRTKFFLAFAFAGATLASAPLKAQTSTWTIDTAHSNVNFQVRHLAVSTVRGSIGGVKGTIVQDEKDITKSTINASADAATVNTGTEARDKHLKSPDFFDVAKYPQLLFKSTAITGTPGKLKLVGDLTLAGVTKSVTLDIDGPSAPQKTPKGVTISGFSASGLISRKDFEFGTKSSASPTIGDEIKFTIDLEIDKQ
ncbi:YceI family protein [Granulicella sp. dw_53]|uniref:YceI family protein n=1 Tax=Granulicella sp. dw_53 TaxID=2719792 RepID=UPI001BD3D03F|nr:YceI family protein [Granulicella sp. dw_53]